MNPERTIREKFLLACGSHKHCVTMSDRGHTIRLDILDSDGTRLFFAESERSGLPGLLRVLEVFIDRLVVEARRLQRRAMRRPSSRNRTSESLVKPRRLS